jgi:hypothetical protein
MSHTYRLCTLKLESDFELPELTAWGGPTDSPADVVFRLGAVPPRLDAPDHVAPIFQTKGHSEYLLALPGTGRILVRNGSHVAIDPEPRADSTDTRAILAGPIQAVLWHQRGLLPLHASSVVVNGLAVALAGPPAAGKSTLAAALSAEGHKILADDVCVVDVGDGADVTVLPGFPRLRLWRDALDRLGIAAKGLQRALSSGEKYFVDPCEGFACEPQKLGAVIVLSRGASVTPTIDRLRGAHIIGALHEIVHTRRPARALGRHTQIFAALTRLAPTRVTVWRLKVPDDPACLNETATKVLTTLEARG